MKKILIAGDSFAADWTKKYDGCGWVNLLSKDYIVDNLAEAGVSEYKIYKQLENINKSDYYKIIISHTSPYRIPVKKHPLHENDLLHYNCDLIYSDLKEKEENINVKSIINFFENYFYEEFYEFTYSLIIKEIKTILPQAIHITFFDINDPEILNFKSVFIKNRGKINHLNEKGNNLIYKKIKNLIDEK